MRFNIPLALGTATLLLLCSAHATRNHPCDRNGFVELGDNQQEFLACELNPDGDYSLHRMRCQGNMIFSSEQGRCISSVRFVLPADGSDIENPTIPPDNLDESTTDVVPGTTKESPFDDDGTTDNPESSDSTESTLSTEGSDATDSTDSSDSPASTESSDATDNTETSDSPVSTESSDATDNTDSSESTASTESSDATDNTDSSESTASTEGSDGTGSTEDPGTDTTATTDENGGTTSGVTDIPRCATTGSYPISGDCSKYLLCYASESDEIGSIVQDCPSTMKFNPRTRYCDVDYSC